MVGHAFHPEILRAYDIRGTFGKTLFEEDAFALGRTFGAWLSEQGGNRVTVGYDGRHSSPLLAKALISGLMASGMDVLAVGMGPTPYVYFSVLHLKADAGIMVTGSHNPPADNGFKIMLKDAPFFGEDIKALGLRAALGQWGAEGQGSLLAANCLAVYTRKLLARSDVQTPLRIAWDCGNGAAGSVLPQVLSLIPGEHILLNREVDGDFPGHPPDPTKPENIVELIGTVREQKLDLGLAFDGDADRLVAVDHEGKVLYGDQLLMIFAQAVLEETPGATIVGDVKCSDKFFEFVTRCGGHPVMSPTGHSYIKDTIKKTQAVLAGEVSGHYFFKDRYFGFDDGLYSALRLVEFLSHSCLSLSEHLKLIPQAVTTPEIKIHCGERDKREVIRYVGEYLQKAGVSYQKLDGVRVKTSQGWWLVRASNTEALVVVRAEAESLGALKELIHQIEEYFQAAVPSSLGIDWSVLRDRKI